jgi:two-component system chemotaxis sensor kinase CheA
MMQKHSGFSTAEQVTDISGRGVGLDVVKNKIESLGGSIFIESVMGEGTTFSIQLPLSLSILSALMVEINEEKYAIPLSSIIETMVIRKKMIMKAHNQIVFDFRGKIVPLVFLQEVFGFQKIKIEENAVYSIVVVKKGKRWLD